MTWNDDDVLFDLKEAICVADFILALIFGVPLM